MYLGILSQSARFRFYNRFALEKQWIHSSTSMHTAAIINRRESLNSFPADKYRDRIIQTENSDDLTHFARYVGVKADM